MKNTCIYVCYLIVTVCVKHYFNPSIQQSGNGKPQYPVTLIRVSGRWSLFQHAMGVPVYHGFTHGFIQGDVYFMLPMLRPQITSWVLWSNTSELDWYSLGSWKKLCSSKQDTLDTLDNSLCKFRRSVEINGRQFRGKRTSSSKQFSEHTTSLGNYPIFIPSNIVGLQALVLKAGGGCFKFHC